MPPNDKPKQGGKANKIIKALNHRLDVKMELNLVTEDLNIILA